MPERNRVAPTGEIIAAPYRGAWTGNRGVLHEGHDIVRFHAGDLWITCALRFRDRRREQWAPNRWTSLYFYDEAVSFAAGHRPCGECRRESYQAYRQAWAEGLGVPPPYAGAMNRVLHTERIHRGTHRRRCHDVPWSELRDGAFVLLDGGVAAVVAGRHLTEWARDGYGSRHVLPSTGTARAITPPATLAVLRAGYPVQIDDTAR